MIHLDYLLVIGILLSVLLSYLLYPLYELTDYREEFTSIVIIAAINIKIIINLSIFMIADKIRTKWISKLLLIIWVVLVECLYSPINLSYIVFLCISGGIVLIERFLSRRKQI